MFQKQDININFSQGLDTKTDPFQVPMGKFLGLENSVFDKGGRLTKRNGYTQLKGNSPAPFLTTLNDNLTTIGTSIGSYNADTQNWVQKGTTQPLILSTMPLVRNSINQTQCDSAISPNGLICTVYSESQNGTNDYKYVIADSATGQNIVSPTLIPATGGGTITGSPRVFALGFYFVVVFTNVVSATPHLQYICISSTNPSTVTTAADIDASYSSATTVSWDGVAVGQNLYIAYNTTTGGQAIKVIYLTQQQAAAGQSPTNTVTFTGANNRASMMTLCADTTNSASIQIYVSFYSSNTTNGYTLALSTNLTTIFGPQQIISGETILNLASAAQKGVCRVFREVSNNYSYDSAIPSHYIKTVDVTISGSVGTAFNSVRSVGLASKAFIVDGVIYFLAAFQSPFQSTYFLINGSTSIQTVPIVMAKLAYENGGGYLTLGLPSVNVLGQEARVAYLNKDFISSLTVENTSQQTVVGGVYAQTGINLASFNIGPFGIDSAEIAGALHISGGFLWEYDGYLPVEHNFFLWPDSVEAVGSATSGSMTNQEYFYQVIYTWGDNQGNIHRSTPSIPVSVTLTSDTSVDISIPTLRLTYKIANPLKIEIYRWSTGQQVYHQVTSLTSPLLNDLTTDSITYNDKQTDAQISGNAIIYTEGGVIEDVNAPATNIMTLFNSRLWLVDAEDPNLLWFSKQVIEATPVEMSDLLTVFVAPTIGVSGSTGPITALAPMDDKLIIFKKDAIYYINGEGPDNTGANSGYSQPIFITSVVGCVNQQSVVFMAQGLMFQSDKGIWLLNRFNLEATYIGAPVEEFTQFDLLTNTQPMVQSAVNVPQTNQVRFTLSSGMTLMYDYYYQQWGTFVGVPAVSSCIYQSLHTFINSLGNVYQETPNLFLDGSSPVLMKFSTNWVNLAGLQGFERAYYFYLLGEYKSPHLLQLNISYNYNYSYNQSILFRPRNFSSAVPSPFGEQPAPFGSPTDIEQERLFFKKQKCQSFRVDLQEQFDPSFGTQPGEGLTLSGIALKVAMKRGMRPISARQSVG